jgi:uncharacterized membrane protein YeaQ/YmgE (transglycosylase-associated protein family)
MEFLAAAVAGSIGGTVAGATLNKYDLGVFWNAVVGLIGGALECRLAGLLIEDVNSAARQADVGVIFLHIIFGAIGGAVLLLLLGTVRRMLQ